MLMLSPPWKIEWTDSIQVYIGETNMSICCPHYQCCQFYSIKGKTQLMDRRIDQLKLKNKPTIPYHILSS